MVDVETAAPGAARTLAERPWQLLVGLGIWSLWFLAVYVGVSVACAIGPPPGAHSAFNAVNAGLLLLTAATAAGLGWAALACARSMRRLPPGSASPAASRRRFVAGAAAALHGVAAVATVFVGLPLLALPPCV